MFRFPWQIFTRVVLIQSVLVLLAIGASALTARHFFKAQFVEQVEAQLRDTLRSLSADLPRAPGAVPLAWCRDHAAATSLRYTLMGADGKVLCDSHVDPSRVGSHADRPEFQAAIRQGFGQGTRLSQSTGEETLYGALALPERSLVVRAAYPLSKLNASLQVLDASIVVFLLLIAAALGAFAVWSGRILVFPIGRLLVKTRDVLRGSQADAIHSTTELFREEAYGEWSELESSIDDIRRDLMAKAETLSVEREELATLMSAISDAILAVDTEGKPLFFNSRFALHFGNRWNEAALRDRRVRLWEMFRAPEILDAFQRALAQGHSREVKAVSIEREGESKRFFSVSVAPLKKASGAIYGAVGVFHDVTDLKSAEQIRIDFVANVSHELRTPLTSIKGYADTLLIDVGEGRPVDKTFLEIIDRNVARLMSLIRDLLDLSSLESTDVLHKTSVATDEVTSRVLAQLQGALAAKRQAVEKRIDAPVVMADPRRLEQVLTNLLENASKYTSAGGTIRVAWEPGKEAVLLRVSDNGPGIPTEHHARLFERFYRVDKARSREQGGTGLGLAIVKHIMQRHEGTVWVESQPGQGARFTCRFPA